MVAPAFDEDDPVLIRPMTEDDLPAVLKIENASYPNPWSLDSFRHEIHQSPVSHFFVAATAQGRILGYIGIWLIADEMHINNVAVAPEARRMGIARRLLDYVLDRTLFPGIVSATLEVRISNDAAVALYKSLGFVDVGMRRDYYTNPTEDAVLMTLFVNSKPGC